MHGQAAYQRQHEGVPALAVNDAEIKVR